MSWPEFYESPHPAKLFDVWRIFGQAKFIKKQFHLTE